MTDGLTAVSTSPIDRGDVTPRTDPPDRPASPPVGSDGADTPPAEAVDAPEVEHPVVEELRARVQQTATDVRAEAQRRVDTVQRRASRLRTQIEFRREKRDPIRHRLSILTVRAVSWLAGALPHPARVRIAMVIGWWVFRRNAGFRDNVLDNLRHVVGPDASPERLDGIARSIARNGTLNILDLLVSARQTPGQVLAGVDLEPGLAAALADANGNILVTAHLGSFDMIGQALSSLGLRMTVLSGRTTYRVLFDAISHLRGAKGGNVIEPTPSGVREIYRALRRGEVVGIVCDRDFFQNGRPVTFFGAATTLPPGPVRIARDSGAIIQPVFARRVGRRHEIYTLPPFRVERTADAEADIVAGMLRLVATLERAITAEPEQWSIFQRVWPDSPAVPES